MPIRLNIEAETVDEFDKLLARFAAPAVGGIMPEIANAAASDKPATGRGRAAAKKADEAKPAVDPFAQPNASGEAAGASQAGESSAAGEAASAQPSASSPAAEAAAAEGEVTVQMLKDKMAELLKAKSASFAMQTLETATGCKSLSSGSPSVVEKAKDDPEIMRRAYDALHAGISAT